MPTAIKDTWLIHFTPLQSQHACKRLSLFEIKVRGKGIVVRDLTRVVVLCLQWLRD
jgi:hypothetical protein